jgi:hypothetical protein
LIDPAPEPQPHRRRPRYAGKYPRKFEDKYKELDPARDPETIKKVLASGKTPAGHIGRSWSRRPLKSSRPDLETSR